MKNAAETPMRSVLTQAMLPPQLIILLAQKLNPFTSGTPEKIEVMLIHKESRIIQRVGCGRAMSLSAS